MKKENLMPRAVYAVSFAVILIIEILIALFVRDSFIRPYGGDILVTILICCFVRMIFMEKIPLLPLWVFLFAVTVEVLQYFDIVSILGLGDIKFFCYSYRQFFFVRGYNLLRGRLCAVLSA